MTMRQAFLLDIVLGIPACLGGVWLLGHLGVGENVLQVAAMLAIVFPACGIGLIGLHYERKRIEREDDSDD